MQLWDVVYGDQAVEGLSWFQPRPDTSLRLLTDVGAPAASVIDVGAGASALADELLGQGWQDVAVLDTSAKALALMTARLAGRKPPVEAVVADLLDWVPKRTYDLWHDRAALHFLTDERDRSR